MLLKLSIGLFRKNGKGLLLRPGLSRSISKLWYVHRSSLVNEKYPLVERRPLLVRLNYFVVSPTHHFYLCLHNESSESHCISSEFIYQESNKIRQLT